MAILGTTSASRDTVSLDSVTSSIVTTSSCRMAGVVAPKADNPIVSFRVGLSWSCLTKSCVTKDHCAPSSKRMFASVVKCGLRTGAMAVLSRHVEFPILMSVDLLEAGEMGVIVVTNESQNVCQCKGLPLKVGRLNFGSLLVFCVVYGLLEGIVGNT